MPEPEPGEQALQFEDDLTGLFNRRYLTEYLLARVPGRAPGDPLSLLLLDLDGFRQVSERHGAEAADEILTQFADRLRGAFGAGDVVARYGGNSFLVVLPGAGKDRVVEIAERLRAVLATQPLRAGRERQKIALTLSAGIATFPEDGRTPDELVRATTRALAAAKRAGRDRVCAAGRFDARLLPGEDALSTLPCPVFVDREEELGAAEAVLEELRRKQPAVLFVQGEPGAGKSRFLRAFAERARVRGALYVYAACSEAKKHLNGHVLLHLINGYYEKRVEEATVLRARLTPPQRAVLRELVPTFSGWGPEPAEPPSKDRRVLMLQAVETAVAAMAERAPLLVLLDNAGDADAGTLDILRVILRDRKAVLGVIFAFKGDLRALDPRRVPALNAFVAEFEKQRRMPSLSLPPLAREDVRRMIAAILPGAELPDGFVEILTEASRGNPLYLEEAVRGLILRGRIRREGGAWAVSPVSRSDVPPTLDDAISSVLDSLPPETSEILTNAAVIGAQFDVQTLQEVMGRREAETQDAVDRTRETGLIRRAAEEREDRYEFSAGHTREVRYRTTEEEARRRVHERVTTALRAREAQRPEAPAADLAFHAARARGAEPAERGAEEPPSRPARIPEASAPLSPEAARRVADYMRAVLNELRMGRLYPQWGQIAREFRTTAANAIHALFMEVPAVTISVDLSGLRVNGAALPLPGASDAVEGFVALLADRQIASVTLQAGLEPRELDALAAALAAPPPGDGFAVDHWDRFLDREEMRHLDILQRRYVARAAPARAAPEAAAERPLEAPERELLWEALRGLKAAADALKLYPPGHALVEETLTRASAAVMSLVERAPTVTLAAPEGQFLVNGTVVESKGRPGAEFVRDELRRKGWTSLTLGAGMSTEEVRALASVLSVSDAATASRILGSGVFRHVATGLRDYRRVIAGPAKESSGGAAAAPEIRPATEAPAMRADVRARAWLRVPADAFLSERCEREFLPLVESLNFNALVPLAAALVQRLGACLLDENPDRRARAAFMAAASMKRAVGDARTLLLGRMAGPLSECLAKEADPEVLRALQETVRVWVTYGLMAGQLAAVSDFLWLSLRPKLDADDTPREFKIGMLSKLSRLAALTPNPAIDALAVKVPAVRRAAVRVIAMIGPPLVGPLIELIGRSEALELRRAAATALREIGGAAPIDLARTVRADASAERVRRTLEVLEVAGSSQIATPVFTALSHPDASVRTAAVGLVRRVERPLAGAILRRTLFIEDAAVQMAGLSAARELKLAELVPDVSRLVQTSEDEAVLRAGCLYLGECPAPAAVPALRRVFEERSRMMGLVKGFPDDLRAIAVRMAARIPHASAAELLDDARHDRCDAVRRAAGG